MASQCRGLNVGPDTKEDRDAIIDFLLNYYLDLMINEEDKARQLFINDHRLPGNLSNYNAQLWKKFLKFAEDSKDKCLGIIDKINNSVSLEVDQQHPLYMVFSNQNMSVFDSVAKYAGGFFSNDLDVMQEIRKFQRKPGLSTRNTPTA